MSALSPLTRSQRALLLGAMLALALAGLALWTAFCIPVALLSAAMPC